MKPKGLTEEQIRSLGTPQYPAEREFLEEVRRFSDIGFGRMMQLISVHWFKRDAHGALRTGKSYLTSRYKDGTYQP